jgi:penicillin amidase
LEKVSWADMEEINKNAGHIDLDAYNFKAILLSLPEEDGLCA